MAVKKTIKDIDAQIKSLQEEKKRLEEEHFQDQFKELKDVLSDTVLTIPQIKKAIRDADAEKRGKKSKLGKPRKPMTFSEVVCPICGKSFTPASGRQKVCTECKNRSIENDDEQEVESSEKE